jgi:hypothetical protein
MTNGIYTLVAPTSTDSSGNAANGGSSALQANSLYLGGQWDFEDQYAQNETPNATITYEYNAKNVYMVAAAANPSQPGTMQVILDGQPDGTVTVSANKLYNIVQGTSYGTHALQLIIETPGLQAYTFTFG